MEVLSIVLGGECRKERHDHSTVMKNLQYPWGTKGSLYSQKKKDAPRSSCNKCRKLHPQPRGNYLSASLKDYVCRVLCSCLAGSESRACRNLDVAGCIREAAQFKQLLILLGLSHSE